jgi:formiminotetrahydrofolate cyclodeaminase
LPTAASLGKATIEEFRDRVASTEPTPAGVSVSAVSASFGFSLVEKVLRIAGQRKDFSGDRKKLDFLMDAAQKASSHLSRWADEDAWAFNQYLAAKRLKDAAAIDAALRRAIEIPLQIAREAVSGLDLCAIAAGFIHKALAADLGTAAILFAGAVRATLLSVDANLAQIPAGSQFHRDVLVERHELHDQVIQKTSPNAP